MKVAFAGNVFCENQTIKILKEEFGDVEVTKDNPDFVFGSSMDSVEFLSYQCPRIFVTGENIVPDFNCVDYAVGFHYLSFEDRYRRIPLYCFFEKEYQMAMEKHLHFEKTKERRFCNFVYSNGRDAMNERDEFFYILSNYKRVDSGGRHLNNIGGPVEHKLAFQSNYKFSIAFENARTNGYTTEKIIHAFAAGTIPIYYGNPEISKEFNSKAFINCHDYKSFDEVVDRIIEIDKDDALYESIMSEPIFEGMDQKSDSLVEYRDFLKNVCSQKSNEAIRRCNDCWGARLQKEKIESVNFIKACGEQSLKGKVLRFAQRKGVI